MDHVKAEAFTKQRQFNIEKICLVSLIFKFYDMMFFQIQGLTPDKEVRVSVKALAVSCVGAAAALHPEAFFNSLYLEPLDGLPAEGRRSI